MGKVIVRSFGVSLDGFAAGPEQALEHPLGLRGEELMQWFFPTRTFQSVVLGKEGGETGVDNGMAAEGLSGNGAWILGRNMFGPVRGPWPDESWKGWWGDEPPYHVPVFVLTHHARPPLAMKGGTTFHFVTQGARTALDLAQAAAGGRNVRIGGGAATVREYLREGLIDSLQLSLSPVLMGRGEPLFEGLDLAALGYRCTQTVQGERATHVFIERR